MTGARRGTLWAITCHFNPVGYKRRQRLAVPLVTVELSFDGTFQLRHDDADIVVQLHGRDVMWQKERLLNLALKWLPDRYDKVAWLDCDVIFASDDWAEQAELALDEFSLLHLYQERHDLPRQARPEQAATARLRPTLLRVTERRRCVKAGDLWPRSTLSRDRTLPRWRLSSVPTCGR